MLRKLIAMLVKVFNPSYIGMYSACKSHVYKRNQEKKLPKTSILATATYEIIVLVKLTKKETLQ